MAARRPKPLWVKVRENLPDDQRIRGMARELKISRDAVLGKIVRLWIWVIRHGKIVAPDSVTEHVDALFVDEFTEQSGFSACLIKVGWLRLCEHPERGLIWPNFTEWNSLVNTANEAAAERMRRKRERDRELLRNVAQHERNGVTQELRLDRDRDKEEEKNTPPTPLSGGSVAVDSSAEACVQKVAKKPRKERPPPAELPAELPGTINTPECRAALQKWLDYKRERGQRYKEIGLATLLKQVAEIGPARLIRAIDRSIANNYHGIHEGEGNGQGTSRCGSDVGRTVKYEEEPGKWDHLRPQVPGAPPAPGAPANPPGQ